ncbi:hypothetical protein ACTGW9_11505, partial [Streptococcus suis]
LGCLKDYQNDNFECKTNNLGYNNINHSLSTFRHQARFWTSKSENDVAAVLANHARRLAGGRVVCLALRVRLAPRIG